MLESETNLFITADDRETVVLFDQARSRFRDDIDAHEFTAGNGNDIILCDDTDGLMDCVADFEINELSLAA